MECFVGGTVLMMFRGSRQSRTTSRAGREARVKPVPKTERQTIQPREHTNLEKHNSVRQSVGRHGQIGVAGSGRIQETTNRPLARIRRRNYGHATSRVEKPAESLHNTRLAGHGFNAIAETTQFSDHFSGTALCL